jgi:hypothetical protein
MCRFLVCLDYELTLILKTNIVYRNVRYTSIKCITHKEDEDMPKTCYQKEIQTKLTKGLLDMIILQFLDQEPMHCYQLITKIRKNFGVYFGPSTIYPLC